MSEGIRNFKAPGAGSIRTHVPGIRRIVVSFDEETFEQIRQRAADAKTSFAAAVRELVEWGMMEATDEH